MNKYKKQIGITAVILLVLIICISGALICKRQKKKQENHTSPTENISESVSTTKPSETGKTKNPTQKSTESTENATKESTSQASTEVSTEATTEAPTEASTQAPTEAPTEPVTEPPTEPPTQPKRGENGVITVELFGHNKLGAYPIPKTHKAMTEYLGEEANIAAVVDMSEEDFFGDGLVLGKAKKEDVAALYGEPLYYYNYNTNPKVIEMGYQYGYYTDNPDEKIYVLFQFGEDREYSCICILIGSAYNLNIEKKYNEINQ